MRDTPLRLGSATPWWCFGLLLLAAAVPSHPVTAQGPASTGPCVTIGAPAPQSSFVYRYTDSTGGAADYTNRWLQFSATGSTLETTRTGPTSPSVSTYVSQHHVANDLFVLEKSTASGTDGGGPFTTSMAYTPGVIGDPAYRACVGQSWTIAAVTAVNHSTQGQFSTKTDPGIMKIIGVNVPITVPAGTFDTVHYTKTMTSRGGQVVDEFWKSTRHGVTVKRNHSGPGVVATEILQTIK